MKVKIVNNSSNPLPKYADSGANAFDIHSDVDMLIKEGETQVIETNLIFDLEYPLALRVISRSGLSIKGLVVKNSPGLVDSSYRGSVKVILHNTNLPTKNGDNIFMVKQGDRIAQGYFEVMPQYELEQISESQLTETDRGTKGLGSTGVK